MGLGFANLGQSCLGAVRQFGPGATKVFSLNGMAGVARDRSRWIDSLHRATIEPGSGIVDPARVRAPTSMAFKRSSARLAP